MGEGIFEFGGGGVGLGGVEFVVVGGVGLVGGFVGVVEV